MDSNDSAKFRAHIMGYHNNLVNLIDDYDTLTEIVAKLGKIKLENLRDEFEPALLQVGLNYKNINANIKIRFQNAMIAAKMLSIVTLLVQTFPDEFTPNDLAAIDESLQLFVQTFNIRSFQNEINQHDIESIEKFPLDKINEFLRYFAVNFNQFLNDYSRQAAQMVVGMFRKLDKQKVDNVSDNIFTNKDTIGAFHYVGTFQKYWLLLSHFNFYAINSPEYLERFKQLLDEFVLTYNICIGINQTLNQNTSESVKNLKEAVGSLQDTFDLLPGAVLTRLPGSVTLINPEQYFGNMLNNGPQIN